MDAQQWRSRDGDLILDFRPKAEEEGEPSVSVTAWNDRSPEDTRTLVILTNSEARVDFIFSSGFHVKGRLLLQRQRIDGVPRRGVFADIQFGPGGADGMKVEGFLVAWPVEEALPPEPPEPLPPPEPSTEV